MVVPRPILLVVVSLTLLVGLAWAMRPNTPTQTPTPLGPEANGEQETSNDWSRSVSQLRWELENERRARLALEEQVGALKMELELLTSVMPPRIFDEPQQASQTPAPSSAQEPGALEDESSTEVPFDEAELLEHGISMREVAALSERYETWQMDQIFLRDQARREGWLNKPRFRHQLATLRGSLRQEMSDSDFDLMLYASNQPNRVKLGHLLHASPGAEAGLQDGDLVLSYNDTQIFSPRDLQRAITQAPVGTSSQVRVLRNGEERVTYVPSGPIGAHLKAIRRSPFEP